MRHVIYGLYDPTVAGELIRYVGQTSNGETARRNGHVQEALKTKRRSHRLHWVRSLLKRGIEPAVKILEVTTKGKWEQKERDWIKRLNKQGNRLVNDTAGGDGGAITTGYRWMHNGLVNKFLSPKDAELPGWFAGRLWRAKSKNGYRWVSRGKLSRCISPTEPVPKGWRLGRYYADKRWITNGILSTVIKDDEPIPSGWKVGRSGPVFGKSKGDPLTKEHRKNIGLANRGNKRPDLAARNRRTAELRRAQSNSIQI